MQHQPGFVSANIHVSTDGTRVVNYAQWESAEAFQAMLADPGPRGSTWRRPPAAGARSFRSASVLHASESVHEDTC